jgi:hypothetical protein
VTASPVGLTPLSPQRKWRAITIATLILVPAFWALLMAWVGSVADDDAASDAVAEPNTGVALLVGLAVVPFVFMALAFLSEHPRAPGAVLRAMGLTLLVGIPVWALADGVTGIVAGVGAGGVVALRMDEPQNRRYRVLAVVFASLYTLVMIQLAGAIVLLPAPVFPLTAIGVADHLAERHAARDEAERYAARDEAERRSP